MFAALLKYRVTLYIAFIVTLLVTLFIAFKLIYEQSTLYSWNDQNRFTQLTVDIGFIGYIDR